MLGGVPGVSTSGFHFLTCAFLGAAGPLAVHPQLADKVLLPELGEPDVPPVVGQRAALEVAIKGCGEKKSVSQDALQHFLQTSVLLTVHRRPLGQDGDGSLRHTLLSHHRGDLGAPAVGAHPQEVTGQVVLFGRVQDPPAKRRTKD